MRLKPKTFIFVVGFLTAISLFGQPTGSPSGPVTLQSAAAAGNVVYDFNGNGASSGDSIKLKVRKAPGAGSEPITIALPPGSILRSSDGTAQNMVISAVHGIDIGGGQIRPVSNIVLADQLPVTFVVSAFCAQFDKRNPSSATTFSLDEPDPRLACATRLGHRLPIRSQQAAVWLLTDAITYDRMMRKMPLMRQEWAAAEALAGGCRDTMGGAGLTGQATPSEILELGERILARDPRNMVALFMSVSVATGLAEATPEQLAIEREHARTLLEDADSVKPAEEPAAAWDRTKSLLKEAANMALRSLAVLPGKQAMAKQPTDCASAETAYAKALAEYPDDAAISVGLSTALSCLKRDSEAVYQLERAAALDSTLGGAGQLRRLGDSRYVRIHGSDEGLAELIELAKSSARPPDGFKISSAAEIAAEKQKEFEAQYPALTAWLRIKGMLTGDDGEAKFKSRVEGSALPQLKGLVLAGKPECNSREILVAVPRPAEQSASVAEITLRLDAPLTGRPVAGSEIQWSGGVPSAFTKVPFMLTMEIKRAGIGTLEGAAPIPDLKTEPCPVPAKTKSPTIKKGL